MDVISSNLILVVQLDLDRLDALDKEEPVRGGIQVAICVPPPAATPGPSGSSGSGAQCLPGPSTLEEQLMQAIERRASVQCAKHKRSASSGGVSRKVSCAKLGAGAHTTDTPNTPVTCLPAFVWASSNPAGVGKGLEGSGAGKGLDGAGAGKGQEGSGAGKGQEGPGVAGRQGALGVSGPVGVPSANGLAPPDLVPSPEVPSGVDPIGATGSASCIAGPPHSPALTVTTTLATVTALAQQSPQQSPSFVLSQLLLFNSIHFSLQTYCLTLFLQLITQCE